MYLFNTAGRLLLIIPTGLVPTSVQYVYPSLHNAYCFNLNYRSLFFLSSLPTLVTYAPLPGQLHAKRQTPRRCIYAFHDIARQAQQR